MIQALKTTRIKPKDAIGSAEYALELIKGRKDESALGKDLQDFIDAAKHNEAVYNQAVSEVEAAGKLQSAVKADQASLAKSREDFSAYESEARSDIEAARKDLAADTLRERSSINDAKADLAREKARVEQADKSVKAREAEVANRESAVARLEASLVDRENQVSVLSRQLTDTKDRLKEILAGLK